MNKDSHHKIEHKESHPHLEFEDTLNTNTKKIVLAGNPNVGKSIFFNHLSGIYVDVSNFPGTTISVIKGNYKNYNVYDTPGIYGVSSFNDEEKVARDIILSGDIIINVVNALHLERDIFLTLQLIEMGKKISVLLNFTDELKKRKIKIDVAKLSQLLGVEVIETAAVNKTGFDKLDFAIENARKGNQSPELHHLLHESLSKCGSEAEALMILEGDEYISEKHGVPPSSADNRELLYITRRNRVNDIVSQVEFEDSKQGKFFNLLGKLSVNPFTGIPLLGVILVLVYFFVGDFIAQRVVNYTENTLGKGEFEYHVKSFVANYTYTEMEVILFNDNDIIVDQKIFSFPEGMDYETEKTNEFKIFSRQPGAATEFTFFNPVVKLFFGEFGVVTMTITYLMFLLLPLVCAFYFVMAIMEDSGYLPRLATMMDRAMNKIGLNGKAIIPVMLGFGCVTMATITTRILGSEREKSITTAILQFAIPCSAQLAVIAVLLSGTGPLPITIYVVVIFSVMIGLSTALNKLLPGSSSPLLIDLPMMRIPKLDNIFKKTFFRTYGFIKEAAVWFFVGALMVGLLDITGMLVVIQDVLAPVTTVWLKLPKEAANAFVMGIVRRDFGAAGLFDLSLTSMQITVAIITITLFVPCIASLMVMLNERGWKEGMIVWAGTWVLAFLIGGIVAQIII